MYESSTFDTSSTLNLEKILQPCVQDKALRHTLDSTKYKKTVNCYHGSPACNGEARLTSMDTDTCAMRPPKLANKHYTEEAKSKAQIQAEKPDISTSLTKSLSERSSTCTRNKENDGFVTTSRKNSCIRANNENSRKKPEKTLLQCSTSTGTVPFPCQRERH
jgi:hypothetical protein